MNRTCINTLTFLCLIFLFASCATFRGMPSHGGGKRFDEEQRVLAAAIRHAVTQMDLSGIKGKQVAVDFSNLETSGTGQPIYPGLGAVSLRAGYADTNSFINRVAVPADPGALGQNNYSSNDGNDRWDGGATAAYQFNPSLRTNNNITREDLNYLKKVVEMQLRHKGLQVVPPTKAETLLVILVDVLGTNLSRTDYGVAYRDELGASCELTYYALNPKNQVVISPSQSVGARGAYEETNVRFTPIRKEEHNLTSLDNSLIAPVTIWDNSSEAPFAEAQTNGYSRLSSYVDALYQRATIQIEANNSEGAAETIERIRALNPEYQNLPELEQGLAEL